MTLACQPYKIALAKVYTSILSARRSHPNSMTIRAKSEGPLLGINKEYYSYHK